MNGYVTPSAAAYLRSVLERRAMAKAIFIDYNVATCGLQLEVLFSLEQVGAIMIHADPPVFVPVSLLNKLRASSIHVDDDNRIFTLKLF